MKSLLRRYAPVAIWSGAIFALSSFPSTPAPETWWNFLLKKGAHVIEYAILYVLAFKTTDNRQPTTNRHIKSFIFTILYAITDEIHQSFVPGRHGRWYDVGFDAIGASIALIVFRRNKSTRRMMGSTTRPD